MTPLASLWVGPLGPIEYASIASFQRFGHPLIVYSYTPMDLPSGVEWRDANAIMPVNHVTVYKREGSPALHANMFRYAMIEKTGLTWVDLDIIALRAFEFETTHVYGYEDAYRVNNAVLRLPSTSRTLADLRHFVPGMRGIAPHVTGLRRLKYKLKTLGRGLPIEEWPWGSTGPRALSVFLRRHDELKHALPVDAFYPISPRDCRRFLVPGELTDNSFGPDTYGVHLSASNVQKVLKAEFGGTIPPDSFLGVHVAKAREQGLPC